ncbi:MAG TPA: vitamin K epoxide reductase family protein [Aeromicrobium sp.]|nr:vitamin K epoxide reductase family protein [Aeromicrobium sp.]HKY57067.1 vitamin K epoxide reductase family protein [Aeromicrobium sp.]
MTDSPAPAESRAPALLLVITGAIGLFASLLLSVDKVTQLQDKIAGKDSVFACDFSAWVSCSSVIASPQSEAFGFPNSFIGVIGFAVVLTLGVVWLSGAPTKGWIWGGLQAGTVFGISFVTWLQHETIYEIGALCPYCMVVWVVMIPLFVGVTAHSLRLIAPEAGITRFLSNWTVLIVALWYVAVAAAIWFEFGSRIWA